ncbi:MAG: hypothetical protein IT429_06035 [Gemmataceae bacterium]|nr:hypothetical protein [Gemmataceae bacterium]
MGLLVFLILLVINAVVLAVALTVGMWLGSFQFGIIRIFAARAAGLLVGVTLVWLLTSFWLALVVWFFAFWLLFQIDPREALIMTGAVFVTTFLVNFFLFALLLQMGGGVTQQ